MSSFFSLRNRRAAAVAIAAIATVALLTSACSLLGPKTVQYTDDDGRNVSIKANPQRIISMAPSNSEILFALGLGDKVVGVSNYDNYPPEAQQKEKIGDAFTPNLEKIVSLKPDLVLAPEGAATKKVEDLKIPVFILNAKKVADVLSTSPPSVRSRAPRKRRPRSTPRSKPSSTRWPPRCPPSRKTSGPPCSGTSAANGPSAPAPSSTTSSRWRAAGTSRRTSRRLTRNSARNRCSRPTLT